MDEPIVAYQTSQGLVCPDPECLYWYSDLMQTAKPLTEDDIKGRYEREQACVSCHSYLVRRSA